MSYATDLKRITRRLEASGGRRIARRNALRDLDTLLKRIRRELRAKYPTIGKDGAEIVPTMLPRGERRCPTDGAYVPTPGAFAKHVIKAHGGKCWCGFHPKNAKLMELAAKGLVRMEAPIKGRYGASMRGHFMRHKDNLASHVMVGVIKEMAKAGAATP